jgi:hypothetical protein
LAGFLGARSRTRASSAGRPAPRTPWRATWISRAAWFLWSSRLRRAQPGAFQEHAKTRCILRPSDLEGAVAW